MTSFAHEPGCLTDRVCYGECVHDEKTGKRIDPLEITREVTADGEVVYHRLRQQKVIFPSQPHA